MAGPTTQVAKIVRAPREMAYRAFLDPAALVVWLPPVTGKIHAFDGIEGGGYRPCRDIPASTRPEDNEAGCRSSLEKLARWLETAGGGARLS